MPGYTGSSCKDGENCEDFTNMTIYNSISNKLNLVILLLLINLAICFLKVFKK